MAASYLSP